MTVTKQTYQMDAARLSWLSQTKMEPILGKSRSRSSSCRVVLEILKIAASWHTVFIEVSCVVEVQLDAFIRQACHVAGTRFSSRSATELQCRKSSWNKHDIRY
jgi:hypothetical protein